MKKLRGCYHGICSRLAAGTALLLVFATVAHGTGAASGLNPWPPTFSARYDLYNRGVRVAEMQRHMGPSPDGGYLFRSETHTTGLLAVLRKDRIVEESHWRLENGAMQSMAYRYTRTGKKERKVDVTFNWDSRRITNTINGESWRMPAVPEVVDKLLYQFALMSDLRAGDTELDYTVADGGKIKIYEIEPLGPEMVETRLGKLDALKFRHQKVGDDRVTTLWCAPRYQYLPVQVEFVEKDGTRVLVVLNSVTGL